MAITQSTKLKAFGALILLSVLWGYNWVVMKYALLDAGAFQFGAMRTFLGALCLMLVMWAMKKPLKPKELPMLIVLGVLQTCGFTDLHHAILGHGASVAFAW